MATAHHPLKIVSVYSIVIAVISIVFTAIFYLTNAYTALWTGYFVNLVLFLGVLFAIFHYNRQHRDKSSSKALFATGLRITLIVTVALTLFTLILHLVVQANPGGSLQANGDENPQGVDIKRNFWIFLITNVFFSNAIVGVLASIMGAMYFKRNQQTPKGG
jgi:membrane protease YdiL (CAAX protease family)